VTTSASGRRQIFTAPIRAVKLKTWKTEKLTARTLTQIARIPDFQDFRFSPAPPYPKSCRMSLDCGGVGNVLLEPGAYGLAYINNQLTS
jgi:hypothetical protein